MDGLDGMDRIDDVLNRAQSAIQVSLTPSLQCSQHCKVTNA